MSFSRTSLLSRQSLGEVLAGVPDPRDPRGVRHGVRSVLALSLVAVLAGCRTLTAMWEHVAALTAGELAELGIEPGTPLPSESTIRRVLQRVDAAELDRRVSAWLRTRSGVLAGRRVIAVDGKTLRGARDRQARAPHLLAALDHATGTTMGQQRVADASNEIPALPELLEPMELAGAVITADAMHTQRATAAWIRSRDAHYLLTVKDNQKNLRQALHRLPWNKIPAVSWADRSHGRRVRRTLKAIQVPAWAELDFPGIAQILQLRRTRTIDGTRRTHTVYLICSLPMHHAQPDTIATWIRGHWGIENRLHWIRDVTYNEDRHQLRTGNGPHTMASLRNTAISLIRLTHGPHAPIAKTTRTHTRHPTQAIKLLTNTT